MLGMSQGLRYISTVYVDEINILSINISGCIIRGILICTTNYLWFENYTEIMFHDWKLLKECQLNTSSKEFQHKIFSDQRRLFLPI
jgi:hypothetical protein